MNLSSLQNIYLFEGLTDSELEPVAGCAREEVVEPDAFVYHKGEEGRDFYVIVEGRVQLIVEKHGSLTCVAEQISAGGHFGEVSLLTGKPRSLHVKALKKTRLLVFDVQCFKTVLLANPHIHERLDRALAERLSLAARERQEAGSYGSGLGHGQGADTSAKYGGPNLGGLRGRESESPVTFREDLELARKLKSKIELFAGWNTPVLICGESGTGRRLAAKQIHQFSSRREQPYIELDMRQSKSWVWEGKLFGQKRDSFPFSSGRQLGILEQVHHGTLVLYHAEKISWELQQMLFYAYRSGKFSSVDSELEQDLDTRFIFIADETTCRETGEPLFIPGLEKIFAENRFTLPPLREHKEDLLPLVRYYLQIYNSELGKEVRDISPDALGMLMRYDWPGNLTELSNVVQRAVMVCSGDVILPGHIFLGVKKSSERLSFNLLQLPWVRQMFKGGLMRTATLVSFVFFCIILLNLFFGPQQAERNLGITLCWYIGWPLLIISFFFLPRYWCSICALSAPGKHLQKIIHPTRRVPAFVSAYSGWIMAGLGLLVFWAEIVFNAYDRPRLTGAILLAIAAGALVFSILFERYSWCRYVCPLGALNAIFSMPSILELRANREMCLNQCRDHACYRDTASTTGCPMYRHPFLVDNNRDCILCGRCINNCTLRSIELNLRIAPQELWALQNARMSDNFLIVSLGMIYFILVSHHAYQALSARLGGCLPVSPVAGTVLGGTVLFGAAIIAGWCAYLAFSFLEAKILGKELRRTATVFGYGLLPLVLGGFLAYYADLFIRKSWLLVPNFLYLFGIELELEGFRLVPVIWTATFLHIIIIGGLLASGYATYKITRRLGGENFRVGHLGFPLLGLLGLGIAFLNMI